MKKLLIILVLLIAICGCNKGNKDPEPEVNPEPEQQDVTPSEEPEKQVSKFASLPSSMTTEYVQDNAKENYYYSYDNDGNLTNIYIFQDGKMLQKTSINYENGKQAARHVEVYFDDQKDHEYTTNISYDGEYRIESTDYTENDGTTYNITAKYFEIKDKNFEVSWVLHEEGYEDRVENTEYVFDGKLPVSGKTVSNMSDEIYEYKYEFDENQNMTYQEVYNPHLGEKMIYNYIYEDGLLKESTEFLGTESYSKSVYRYEYNDDYHAFALK